MRLLSGLLFAFSVIPSAYSHQDQCEQKLIASEARIATRANALSNPLLQNSNLPHQVYAFDAIRNEHFAPALTMGLRMARRRLQRLRLNTDAPSFANTIMAIEDMSRPFEQAAGVLDMYGSLRSTREIVALEERFTSEMSTFSDALYLDDTIFKRVKQLYDTKQTIGLDAEQLRLLELVYFRFVNSGAGLVDTDKRRLEEIGQKLGLLRLQYGVNLRESARTSAIVVEDSAELDGLSTRVIEAAATEAKERSQEGKWVITIDGSTVSEVLDTAKHAPLREKVWRAHQSRGTGGAYDNRSILLDMVKLRHENAKILGYEHHADYVLEDRILKHPDEAFKFLSNLASVYTPFAQREKEQLEAFAGRSLHPWDVGFYAEALRKQLFAFNDEDLRPYLDLDRVLEGAFYASTRLYGVSFHERGDIPVWEPSVKVYEVRDRNGDYLAMFYFDPYARNGKSDGAWKQDIRGGGLIEGVAERPHVLNVLNLAQPAKGKPTLLTMDDVRTVFHELGHGLHSILSRVRYESLAGTRVTRDFVELPSQIFENWAYDPDVLAVYARHVDTGEAMPRELLERAVKARNFRAGSAGLRQVTFAVLDLTWYTTNTDVLTASDIEAFEKSAMARYNLPEGLPGFLRSPNFAHIFSGGYSAGYYSYKWSEVLAADAFELFKEAGLFDPATSDRFRQEILERGNADDPEVLYRNFRGRDPDPAALPRSEGLAGE